MSCSIYRPWLHRFAWLTALVTLGLVGLGGLVTSHEAGMSVPDWPNSYGYNMFLFPISKWAGGILYEHTHRLVATVVGVLVVVLTRWLGGRGSRLPLIVIGLVEIVAGVTLTYYRPELKGAGYFLSGIGSVVLIAGAVWFHSEPAPKSTRLLGWVAFWAVQIQGLLGGLRVVLSQNEIGIFHAALAQAFFVLLCVIVVMTSRRWLLRQPTAQFWLPTGYTVITGLIFLQLVLGATMRHQHAGLSIPDFPLAYNKVWPAMDDASIELYNQHRMESVNVNPITAFQVALQMLHRIVALIITICIGASTWRAIRKFGARSGFARANMAWFGLVLLQAGLGAATIWTNKAADVATAHVLVGALLLATGAIVCLIFHRTALAGETPEAVPFASPFHDQPLAAAKPL